MFSLPMMERYEEMKGYEESEAFEVHSSPSSQAGCSFRACSSDLRAAVEARG